MKALISTIEPCETGYRVAEVSSNEFEVASTLFWVNCSDDVVADQFWYDPQDEQIKPVPEQVPVPIVTQGQPTVNGAQTL